MRKEIHFENRIPINIQELETSLKKMGAWAHLGTSGIFYEQKDRVETGVISRIEDGQEQKVDEDFPVFHTHADTWFYKDGVPVGRVLTFEELEELYDDEIGPIS